MYLGKYTIHGWYGVSKQGILDILILGKNSYNPRAQIFLLPPSTVPNVEETHEVLWTYTLRNFNMEPKNGALE